MTSVAISIYIELDAREETDH